MTINASGWRSGGHGILLTYQFEFFFILIRPDVVHLAQFV